MAFLQQYTLPLKSLCAKNFWAVVYILDHFKKDIFRKVVWDLKIYSRTTASEILNRVIFWYGDGLEILGSNLTLPIVLAIFGKFVWNLKL
jgi:hypothetical protein